MISIAMATYNGGRFLREQIDSILQQTEQNFELIICDDCSKDNTWEILNEYSSLDRRIYCVKNDRNIGFLGNFQKAMLLCKGKYIALCDQDDIWNKNHLELLLKNIGSNMLVAGNSELINVDGKSMDMLLNYQLGIDYQYKNSKEMAMTILFFRNWIQGASMMVRKEFLDIVLPFPKGVEYQDSWIAAMACLTENISYIETPITKYRQHGNNTSDKHQVRRNKLLIWLKHFLKANAFSDRLALTEALKERLTNATPEQVQLLDDAIAYHQRQVHWWGRLQNFVYEMKNRKLIYSIKD